MARVCGTALFFANDDAALQFGKAHLVKFIEVVGVNPQKTHALDQRIAFVRRFLKYALVEG